MLKAATETGAGGHVGNASLTAQIDDANARNANAKRVRPNLIARTQTPTVADWRAELHLVSLRSIFYPENTSMRYIALFSNYYRDKNMLNNKGPIKGDLSSLHFNQRQGIQLTSA
jgi:hypothetical protein